MSVEINQIPITTTSITSGSFFPLDLATGGSPAYGTRKATLNTLANEILDEKLTANRALNINGNMLKFDNGQVVIGSEIGSPSKLEVGASGSTRAIVALSTGGIAINGYDGTGQGVLGGTVSGFGVLGAASGNGIGVYGQSVSGVAGHMDGGLLVEPYAFGSAFAPSSVATFNATNKGILIPRLTTTQRDAISSPATSLLIYNTTTARFEHWNGTYWAGHRNVINVFHGAWSNPADGQTVAFGAMPIAPQSSAPLFSAFGIVLRGNGVIRACTLNAWCSGTVGTNEAWSLYIRHNSTDYLVASVGNTNAIKVFQNTSLNIPYVDGDTMKMIFVNPNWATNPGGVISQGTVTLE